MGTYQSLADSIVTFERLKDSILTFGYDQHTIGSLLTDGIKQVYIAADTENRSTDYSVAQNPVENGSVVTDHVAMSGDTGQITGWLLGDGNINKDATDYLVTMEGWQRAGTLLKYYGRYYLSPIVIQNVAPSFDKTNNGVKVTLTWSVLHQVESPQGVAPAAKKPENANTTGVYVTVTDSDTYWGWSQKYGTSIEQLRAWNNWPDTGIPTGAQARVQ